MFRLTLSAVLLVLSAMCSASESALLAMNKLSLRIRCRAGDRRALIVARLLKKRDVLINSLLFANCLVNILLSSIVAHTALELWGNAGVSCAAFITTVALLIFGEITPKTLATRRADRIAYALLPFIRVTVAVFRPISSLFTVAARYMLGQNRRDKGAKKASYTEDDIKTVIDEGANSGAVAPIPSEMAQGVFRFADLEAQDIMVPRQSIAAVHADESYDGIISLSRSSGHTRFPVYKRNIDDIAGVVYLKDLLRVKDTEGCRARDVMREPLFILGGKKMSSVQAMLQENRQSMAIVVDEYSGTDGLLTIEDITRRIFDLPYRQHGDDCRADSISTMPSADGAAGQPHLGMREDERGGAGERTSGAALLREVSDRWHIPLTSEINETLGGWIAEKLDRLPVAGDCVHFMGYSFRVIEVSDRRVASVSIERDEAGYK